MSAERLREAAALMRSDAQRATPGRWKAWGMQVLADQDGTSDVDTAVPVASTFCCDENGRPRTFDLDHIIGMQPAVALAVADWLEDAASSVEACEESLRTNPPIDIRSYMVGTHIKAALAVANAYLGTPDPPDP